jgi:hypothetical protein
MDELSEEAKAKQRWASHVQAGSPDKNSALARAQERAAGDDRTCFCG